LSLSIKRVEGQVLPVRSQTDLDNVPELGLSEDVFAGAETPAPEVEAQSTQESEAEAAAPEAEAAAPEVEAAAEPEPEAPAPEAEQGEEPKNPADEQ
jgi:small subunit ribosomal protein S1